MKSQPELFRSTPWKICQSVRCRGLSFIDSADGELGFGWNFITAVLTGDEDWERVGDAGLSGGVLLRPALFGSHSTVRVLSGTFGFGDGGGLIIGREGAFGEIGELLFLFGLPGLGERFWLCFIVYTWLSNTSKTRL